MPDTLQFPPSKARSTGPQSPGRSRNSKPCIFQIGRLCIRCVKMIDVKQYRAITPRIGNCAASILLSFLDSFFHDTGINIDWALDESVWRTAGRAFQGYAARRRKQRDAGPRRILAAFLIGAHALEREVTHCSRSTIISIAQISPTSPR